MACYSLKPVTKSAGVRRLVFSDRFRYQKRFRLFQPEESVVMSKQRADKLNGISKPYKRFCVRQIYDRTSMTSAP